MILSWLTYTVTKSAYNLETRHKQRFEMVNDWNLQRGGRLLEAVCLANFGLKLPIFLPESMGWAIIRVWAIIRIITVRMSPFFARKK